MGAYFDIVFDGPPGPECGRFVEVEDHNGRGMKIGEWVEREDGYWALRIGQPCHVVWQNTDLTEGRGGLRPIGWFESLSDAVAFGKGKDVQGSDCRVSNDSVIPLRATFGSMYGPVHLTPASKEGAKLDEKAELKRQTIERAKNAGLSDEEIAVLTGTSQ